MKSKLEPCSTKYGDKEHFAFALTCTNPECKAREVIHANTWRVGKGFDDHIQEQHVLKKFKEHGWRVQGRALCPKCLKDRPRKKKYDKQEENLMADVIPMGPPKVPPKQPVSEPLPMPQQEPQPDKPRESSKEDRILIRAKLNEVYSLKEGLVGYLSGWNDAKLAKDLGVPIEWISAIREPDYGPNDNEEALIAEGWQKLDIARKMIDYESGRLSQIFKQWSEDYELLCERFQEFKKAADILERNLIDLRKRIA